MDFSRLHRFEVVGALSSLALVVSLFLLPWFSLTDTQERVAQEAWICGEGEFSCTGWQTFPILRWLLLAAASAPLILAWIVVNKRQLAWPPGEMTMVVGFAAMVLIGFNGIIDKPLSGAQQFGISIDFGYWVALLSTIAMAGAGAFRSLEHGGGTQRRPPGTF